MALILAAQQHQQVCVLFKHVVCVLMLKAPCLLPGGVVAPPKSKRPCTE